MTAPTNPHWSDIYTAEELAAAVELDAAKLAKRHGYYEIAAELGMAADALRELSERCAARVPLDRDPDFAYEQERDG